MNLIIATDYTNLPGPRFRKQGPFSGEEFRESVLRPKFEEAREKGELLHIDLDGGYGYGTSFLEEAFGGLAREYDPDTVLNSIELKSDEEPYQIEAIRGYIRDAKRGAKRVNATAPSVRS
ncbi:MAG TPA: STAS-like domain-containing protein [Bryobacteraceae bacterium]|jgi:hypothetical protein